MAGHEVYEFGAFTVNVAERRLLRRGQPVALAPKAFDLLVTLVRRAGSLVTKRELLDTVWPDTFVEEGILAVHISALRRALDNRDGPSPQRTIETVPRTGYRFLAEVTHASPLHGDVLSIRWPIGVLPAQPAVYELIGRGRAHLLSASRAEIPDAIAAFTSAIELDPTYAAAHAGLALACCAQAELRLGPPAGAYESARTAALRALAMERANADAQVALGTVLFLSDWNWIGARRCLERALEIDPDHTDAWLLYGRVLEALGDLANGLAAKQKALERNPSSPQVHLQIAHSYWNQRSYDRVIEWSERTLQLDPRHLLAREYLAGAYWKKGDVDRHMAENLRHAEAAGAPAAMTAELQRLYSNEGRAGVIAYGLRQGAAQGAPDAQLALLHGEAGNLDQAFLHLHAAIDVHDPCLVHLAVGPQWDALRGDRRFDECLGRMGLTPERGPSVVSG